MRRGLTLVEVLIVVTLLALIASLALPALLRHGRGQATATYDQRLQTALLQMRALAAHHNQDLRIQIEQGQWEAHSTDANIQPSLLRTWPWAPAAAVTVLDAHNGSALDRFPIGADGTTPDLRLQWQHAHTTHTATLFGISGQWIPETP